MSHGEHYGRKLRELVSRGPVIAPGVFDALVGRAVREAGFEVAYVSGAATAAIAGYPDIGLITLTEMAQTIRRIADATRLPLIVDGDTGYGEVESVIRTVVEYERSGAAAIHIEDQVFPKRCGHLQGKTLVPADSMVEKVAAAVENRLSPELVIIARTDARAVSGLDDAIARANAYRRAGADMIFPEGLESIDEFRRFAEESPGWLMANMTEFGRTPQINREQFAEMGYDVVIFPVSLLRVAMAHVTRAIDVLKDNGSFGELVGEMQTRRELYALLNYTPGEQWNYPNVAEFSTGFE